MDDIQEKFKDFGLLEEYDILKKRSKIIEIVAKSEVIFALAKSGVSAAFSRETNQRICFLNVSPDEFIGSLFYNKYNDSLITASVHASDSFKSLKCRSTKLEYIRRGKPEAGIALFETESLEWPGFVEFDDVNGKVITCSDKYKILKVFDLKNYSMLYTIQDDHVEDFKISPGVMMLIFARLANKLPLKLITIDDGTVRKAFDYLLLDPSAKVDIIELFNENLIVKQANENLYITDVPDRETEVVAGFRTPTAFIFLYKIPLFMTFLNRTVAVWNFQGERVTSFEDHLLWHPEFNPSSTYVTSDHGLIISFCKAESEDSWEQSAAGSINISNILTGQRLAKIHASNTSIAESSSTTSNNKVEEALEGITALFYNEERNEIYTGNRQGLVHVWSNGKNNTSPKNQP